MAQRRCSGGLTRPQPGAAGPAPIPDFSLSPSSYAGFQPRVPWPPVIPPGAYCHQQYSVLRTRMCSNRSSRRPRGHLWPHVHTALLAAVRRLGGSVARREEGGGRPEGCAGAASSDRPRTAAFCGGAGQQRTAVLPGAGRRAAGTLGTRRAQQSRHSSCSPCMTLGETRSPVAFAAAFIGVLSAR